MARLIVLLATALLLSALVAESQEPPPLTLTAPVPYETFQRRPTNVGSIFLTGTTTDFGNIEARFNGGPWSRVARNVLPGPWTGELAVQQSGQGPLECRFTGRPETTVTVESVGLGDVYVIAGQSNAVGAGDTLHTADHPVFTAAMWGTDGVWQPMIDPTTVGAKGSVWPLVATQLMSTRGVPVAIIPCAAGGHEYRRMAAGRGALRQPHREGQAAGRRQGSALVAGREGRWTRHYAGGLLRGREVPRSRHPERSALQDSRGLAPDGTAPVG